jgi:hypothetical protein
MTNDMSGSPGLPRRLEDGVDCSFEPWTLFLTAWSYSSNRLCWYFGSDLRSRVDRGVCCEAEASGELVELGTRGTDAPAMSLKAWGLRFCRDESNTKGVRQLWHNMAVVVESVNVKFDHDSERLGLVVQGVVGPMQANVGRVESRKTGSN